MNNISTNHKIEYDGIEYSSLMDLCEKQGIKYNTIYRRVYMKGKDLNESISELLKKKNKRCFNGFIYKSLTELSKKMNLNRTSISYRLKLGESLETAVNYLLNNEKGDE